jgi:hypothetical protein
VLVGTLKRKIRRISKRRNRVGGRVDGVGEMEAMP